MILTPDGKNAQADSFIAYHRILCSKMTRRMSSTQYGVLGMLTSPTGYRYHLSKPHP